MQNFFKKYVFKRKGRKGTWLKGVLFYFYFYLICLNSVNVFGLDNYRADQLPVINAR